MLQPHTIRLMALFAILVGIIVTGCGANPGPPPPPVPPGPGGGGGGPPPAVGEGAWKTRETVVLTREQAKLVVPKSFRVSPDGRRFGYVLSQSGGHVAVIDQAEFPTVFEQVADVRFSGDGKDVAIAGRLPAARAFAEPQPVVVLNGKTILPQYVASGANGLKAEAPELLAVADGRVLYTVETTLNGHFTFADGERLGRRDSFDGPNAVVAKLKGQAAFARRDVQRTVWSQFGTVAGSPDAVISANGAAWATVTRAGEEHEVAIDGEVRKKFPQVSGFAFSPDGKRHAYFAARPETRKSYLVVDGVVSENPGGAGVGFAFSPDGSRWAAQTATRVIVDGTPHKAYSAVPGKSQFVRQVTDGVPTVAFSPDGKHVAYLAHQQTRPGPDGKDVLDPHAFLVVDGKEVKEWAAVGADLFWSADNRTVGYVATPKGKAAVVVVGDKEWPAFDETTPLGFGPDGLSFAARVRHTEQQSVVIDGRRRGQYEEVGLGGTRVGFTPAGKVTYLARKPDNSVVWVEELRADLPDDGGPRLAAAPKAGDEAGGWVPLFNGRDLSNWSSPALSESPFTEPRPANQLKWTVAGGRLTFTGRDSSYLETAGQEFRRFHLRAEVKTQPGTHARLEFGRGAEVWIDNGAKTWRTGSLVAGVEKSGDGVTDKLAADGEWFTLEVLATGGRTVTRVNGMRVAEAKRPDLPAGPLRFVVRNQYPVPFEVRKIEYRPLADEADLDRPGTLAKPAQDPPVKGTADPLLAPVEGFTPLFNGKDTAGWVADRYGRLWDVRDGMLVGAGAGGHAVMFTDKDYRNFHLRAVVRTAVGGHGEIIVRAQRGKQPQLSPTEYYTVFLNNAPRTSDSTGKMSLRGGSSSYELKGARGGAEDGKWVLVEVIAEDRLVKTKVDGRVVTEFRHDPIKFANGRVVDSALLGGRIGLKYDGTSNGSPVEFARVDIRELK